jgi:hypothetical protein
MFSLFFFVFLFFLNAEGSFVKLVKFTPRFTSLVRPTTRQPVSFLLQGFRRDFSTATVYCRSPLIGTQTLGIRASSIDPTVFSKPFSTRANLKEKVKVVEEETHYSLVDWMAEREAERLAEAKAKAEAEAETKPYIERISEVANDVIAKVEAHGKKEFLKNFSILAPYVETYLNRVKDPHGKRFLTWAFIGLGVFVTYAAVEKAYKNFLWVKEKGEKALEVAKEEAEEFVNKAKAEKEVLEGELVVFAQDAQQKYEDFITGAKDWFKQTAVDFDIKDDKGNEDEAARLFQLFSEDQYFALEAELNSFFDFEEVDFFEVLARLYPQDFTNEVKTIFYFVD